MEFARDTSVEKYSDIVAEFEAAVAAGWNSPTAKATVSVEQDHKGRDAIIFEIKEPYSKKPARIACAPDESPRSVERRAYTALGENIQTTGAT